LKKGRLQLFTHWFYVTSFFYFQLPDDLRAELAAADLVIFKGDVNYRRLIGEVHWPPTTPFAQTTAYFPAPLVALRTCKGELIVGLAQGEAERLQAQDPTWMVNGRRGPDTGPALKDAGTAYFYCNVISTRWGRLDHERHERRTCFFRAFRCFRDLRGPKPHAGGQPWRCRATQCDLKNEGQVNLLRDQ